MKYIISLILLCNLHACAQHQKEQQKMYDITKHIHPEVKDITVNNYEKKLYNEIKHYPEEPIYYLRINKQNCLIEVLVNDVYTHLDYELPNFATPFRIAGKILKTGKQIVTVRMYPVENLVNESFDREGEPIKELLNNSSVTIKVVKIDNKSQKSFEDEVEVIEHTSPTKNGKFIGAGKPYYEYTFSFNAQVPYEFEGWTKGQDLRKLDSFAVTSQALRFYSMVQDIFVNKDIDAWLKLEYLSSKRTCRSLYVNKQYIEELFEEQKEPFKYDLKKLPIKEYKLDFRGNGKLLELIHTNSDPYYRDKLAAELEFSFEDGEIGSYFPPITLYLPEGRSLEEGLMMWK